MEDPVVVVVELPEGGRGRVVLDSGGVDVGAGAGATAVVVAMEGETGWATFITECVLMGSASRCSS